VSGHMKNINSITLRVAEAFQRELVFKEGVCEAMALQTLRRADYEMKAASLEKELEIGHTKCKNLLFDLDKAKSKMGSVEKTQTKLGEERQEIQVIDGKQLVRETLKSFQMIKGISYYLGYPLAKTVLEKYGIKGVKLALEKHPLDKAEYFANPCGYLIRLEKQIAFTE